MLKKPISMLFAVCMIFCLSACGTMETENSQVSSIVEEVKGNDTTQTQNPVSQSNPTSNTNQPNHTHKYSKATCTSPKKCTCGVTTGTALGHQFSSATCTSPQICSRCGITSGSALGHNYSDKYCTRCGANNPNYKEKISSVPTHTHYYNSQVTTEATCAKEGVRTYTCSCGHSYTEKISKTSYHDWEYATCTNPKTCKDCGIKEGTAKGHSYYSSGKCSCGAVNPIVTETLAKCSLTIPSLPKSVSYYGYNNKLYTTVSVTNITYKFECDNDGKIELELYFSGEKTYDYRGAGQSDSCKIGWKLYGPSGAVVESDTFYSPSVAMGESFSNQREYAFNTYDNLPAGNYRLEISNVN